MKNAELRMQNGDSRGAEMEDNVLLIKKQRVRRKVYQAVQISFGRKARVRPLKAAASERYGHRSKLQGGLARSKRPRLHLEDEYRFKRSGRNRVLARTSFRNWLYHRKTIRERLFRQRGIDKTPRQHNQNNKAKQFGRQNNSELREFSDGPYYHHEALNGSGYPQGLTKKDIPYSAQIIRVADEYDALVTKRQYTTHVDISKTLKQLIKLLLSMLVLHNYLMLLIYSLIYYLNTKQ